MSLDRRTLLALGAAAAATPALATKPSDPIAGWTVINALGGLLDPNTPDLPRTVMTPRILGDAHASGMTAVNCTMGYVFGPKEPFESTVADLAYWDRLVRENSRDLLKVFTTTDIARAKAQKKIGLIYGFQNCAMMGKDAKRVDTFADMGVRIFQLTYNNENQLGGGSMAPEDRGLTPFGREVIERINANHCMVDLSHSGRRICLDAARASKQPISINHTGCRALTDLPRNKTDEELRLVAENGGFVGIYFMPFLNLSGHATAADVVAHIEHALKVCGEDHVGIGTDGGTTQIDDLEAYKAALTKEHEDRVAKGISAPGERADTHPFADDLRGPGQFRKLARLLEQRGHKPATVEKVLGGNFVRYARDIWGA
jgi:membrane dipeptidase